MNKNVLALAVLVSILLVINTTFVVIIQSSKSDSNRIAYVGETIGNVLSGYDQLEIFNKPVIESSLSKKTTASKSTTIRSTSTITKKPKPVNDNPPAAMQRSAIRVVKDDNGREIYTVNYDTDTITFPDGKTTSIIIDGNVNPSQNDYYDASQAATASPVAWQQIPYTEFNAFVEQNYYNANQANIIDFLNKLAPRFALMEQTTGWSSEKFGYGKLDLYIDATTSGCFAGSAIPGEAHLSLSNPIYQTSCQKQYYLNGQQQWNNPGPLGDNWIYIASGLHESLHSTNPLPIYARLWLTEGFSEYNMYNILTANNDINQETSDTYLHNGFNGYQWNGYVSNNYRDTTVNDNEIQKSPGYDITAWMFSMLRDDYGLNFDRFYYLVDNNLETLDKADSLRINAVTYQYDDMAVIDLFGRTLGRNNFETETKPIFRYDGSSGPGWGVREWVSRDFYADLRTTIAPALMSNVGLGQQVALTATIYNDGQTNLVNIPVRIYYDKDENTRVILNEQNVNINAGSFVPVSTSISSSENAAYAIVASADPGNIKLETNEANNAAVSFISFGVQQTGCPWEKINGHWVQTCSSQATQIK
ncbi:MAG: CARDB domain-containing protein [Nanoarchaeota archaeon]